MYTGVVRTLVQTENEAYLTDLCDKCMGVVLAFEKRHLRWIASTTHTTEQIAEMSRRIPVLMQAGDMMLRRHRNETIVPPTESWISSCITNDLRPIANREETRGLGNHLITPVFVNTTRILKSRVFLANPTHYWGRFRRGCPMGGHIFWEDTKRT